MVSINQVYSLFSPYFNFGWKGAQRIFILAAVALSCIVSSISIIYVYDALTSLQLLLIQPGAQFSVVAWGVLGCLGPSCIFAGFNAVTHVMSTWLSKELTHALSETLITKWIDGKSYYGLKFINKVDKNVNPAEVLSSDLKKASDTTIKLFTSAVSTIANFFVGAYQLWYLSSPLAVNIFQMSFVVPGYMLMLAFSYSIIYSVIVSYVDKDLTTNDSAFRNKQAEYIANLHHVETYAEAIALKKGGSKERDRLLGKLSEIDKVEETSMLSQSILSFTQNISGKTAYMFGLILSAPGAISGKFDIFKAFSVSQYFANIVKFFSWHKENTTDLSSLEVSVQRIQAFNSVMKEWDEIQKKNGLKLNNNEAGFGVKGLSVSNPQGEAIFHNLSFKIPDGKATVITGPSGIGKTTIFRCFAGLWPFAQGEILIPNSGTKRSEQRVYCIPQQSYFPYRGTLLEAIYYPDTKNQDTMNQAERSEIIKLMKAFGFREETIRDLDIHDEWNKKLSGGEQQKIAIIGALIKRPDVIFIDEGTNALDQKSKALVESYLKQKLPSATIIAIDHGVQTEQKKAAVKPKNMFFDYNLKARVPQRQPVNKRSFGLVRMQQEKKKPASRQSVRM